MQCGTFVVFLFYSSWIAHQLFFTLKNYCEKFYTMLCVDFYNEASFEKSIMMMIDLEMELGWLGTSFRDWIEFNFNYPYDIDVGLSVSIMIVIGCLIYRLIVGVCIFRGDIKVSLKYSCLVQSWVFMLIVLW